MGDVRADIKSEHTIDIGDLIDRTPIAGPQWLIIITCLLASMTDGFDLQIMALVAPAIAKDWALKADVLGPIFSAGIFGGFVGGMFISPWADKIGTKRILIASILLFGPFTLLTCFAKNTATLFVLRFVAAVGMGSGLPSIVTYIAAVSPRRIRPTALAAISVGVGLGAVVGGAIVAFTIDKFGWRLAFIIGGGAPVVLIPIIIWGFCERIPYLVATGCSADKIRQALLQLGKARYIQEATAFAMKSKETSLGILALLRGRKMGTFLLLTYFFVAAIFYFTLSSWLPYVLSKSGAPAHQAAWGGTFLNAGGMIGCIVISWLINRYGAYAMMIGGYMLSSVPLLILMASHGFAASSFLLIFFCGLFGFGAHFCQPVLTITIYPPALHNAGVGMCMAAGRLGGAVGPLVAGKLLTTGGNSVNLLFAFLACFAVFTAIMIALMKWAGDKRRAQHGAT